jgi:hypothetical protein
MRRIATLALALGTAAGIAVLTGSVACADTPVQDNVKFKNVKLLTDVTSKSEMRRIMKDQAASLGVKCSFCHVPGKFELDDKKEKVRARDMIKMVQDLNANMFKDAEKKPAISCWTCHRGNKAPESVVPPEALSAMDSMEPAPGTGEPAK